MPGVVAVVDDLHVVAESGVLTSAGIDPALRADALYHGEAVARAAARHMEYPFPDGNRSRAGIQLTLARSRKTMLEGLPTGV